MSMDADQNLADTPAVIPPSTVMEAVSLLLFSAVRETAEMAYAPGLPSLAVGIEVARASVHQLLPPEHLFSDEAHQAARTEVGLERELGVLGALEAAWKLVAELPAESAMTDLVVEVSDLLREAQHVVRQLH